jgi:bifunctional DNase/RNase
MQLRQCSIRGVFVMVSDQGAAPTVVLDVDEETCIPIFIGLWEAISISQSLRGDVLSRPITHDLFIDLMNRYAIRLTALHIDAIDEGVFYAKLLFSGDCGKESIDCRPSDGIAIALRANAPVCVDEDVIEKAGVNRKLLADMRDVATYFN